jgi:HK97 gp10 family phage protein
MAAQVKITGLQETVRSLRRVGVESADLRDAFGNVSKRVAGEAKKRAPRSTGRLQAGIRASRRQNAAVVTSNTRGRPYHRFVFFGTKRMQARPYLWAAVDAVGDEWVRAEVERGLNAAIRKAGL